MKIAAAAKALGVAENTVRHWIREEDAPTLTPGSSGRGHGAEVDLGALLRWRYGVASDEVVLQAVAQALQDVFIRDGAVEERSIPLWRSLRLPQAATAMLILDSYSRIHRGITGQDLQNLEDYPEELQGLLTVYLESQR